MDREFELLKRMKISKGEDYNEIPTRLPNHELEEFLKKIVVNYSFLFYDNSQTLEEEIQIIIDNIYTLLDVLVRMGVHPGFILAALVNYNREKIKNKDRIAYNNGKKKKDAIFFPYADVRKELKLMKNLNYTGYNTSLSHHYSDILTINKEFSLPYSENPVKLNEERKKTYFISMINQRNNAAEADDIIDESIYIVDLIYTSICLLVEMGINPDKIIINKIIEESEKGKGL